MASFGNTSASGLLKSAEAAYNRTQTYNDSIEAYKFDLSDKAPEDWTAYSSYLKKRASNTTDPSKQLELEKKITAGYRTFNSAEIKRATMSVNYGEMSKTDKYNRMYGLLQAAAANGDDNLAMSIESQMASLSVQIQNEADAAARAGAAAGAKARSTSIADTKRKFSILEDKVQQAYQTGQNLVDDQGNDLGMMDARSYALAHGQLLMQKHQFLSDLAASDPAYQDDVSNLESSNDYRSLVESGLVQKLANGEAGDLAVKFNKDKYGNTYRDFTAIPQSADGKSQYGLVNTGDDGTSKPMFVADRELNNSTVAPGAPNSRVAYDVHDFTKPDGTKVAGVGAYNDLISGNKVLVQTQGEGKGLRATAYNGKKDSRTPDQAAEDLKNLVDAKSYQPGVLDGIGDELAKTHVQDVLPEINPTDALSFAGSHALRAIPGTGNLLGSIFDRATQAQRQKEIAAAEAKRSADLQAEYARQQAIATTPAARAATPAPLKTPAPVIPKAQVYLPTPVVKPADVFAASIANKPKTNKNVAKAIGNAVGYNF